MTTIPEVFPFASIAHEPGFPAWIRGLRRANGVYLLRDVATGEIVYVGESHSGRLYGTLTRHFQAWTNKYRTAGVTYRRHQVEIAVIVVPRTHAAHLQNDLICTLIPRDNRQQCGDIYRTAYEEVEQIVEYDPADALGYGYDFEPVEFGAVEQPDNAPPDDYDYDIPLLLEGITYRFPDEDIPF